METLAEFISQWLDYLPWGEIALDTGKRLAEDLKEAGYCTPAWISVEEGLPEDERDVLCATPEGTVLTLLYCSELREFMNHDCVEIHVAYWMPLPEAPKAAE